MLKIQKSDKCSKDVIHIQQNYYYICSVEDNIKTQNLDDDEKELDFVLKFISIDEAIKANISLDTDDKFIKSMAEREKQVLELFKDKPSLTEQPPLKNCSITKRPIKLTLHILHPLPARTIRLKHPLQVLQSLHAKTTNLSLRHANV